MNMNCIGVEIIHFVTKYGNVFGGTLDLEHRQEADVLCGAGWASPRNC